MKKARSSYDLAPKPDLKFKNPMKYQSSSNLMLSSPKMPQRNGNDGKHRDDGGKQRDDGGKHKVVIYFSDAYNNICNKSNGVQSNGDGDHAARLAKEMQSKTQSSESLKDAGPPGGKDFLTQLKTVLEEKSKFTHKFDNFQPAPKTPPLKNKFLEKPKIPEKPNVVQINQPGSGRGQTNGKSFENGKLLPSYIESIDENNVIKLKIEQNFKKASELVNLIASLPKGRKQRQINETSSIHELNFSHEDDVRSSDDDTVSEPDQGYFYDWSFVQEWRSR